MELSKRYANFVRVGPDGNMGVYDQQGNRFIKESVGADNLPNSIAFLFNSVNFPLNNPYPYTTQFAFNENTSNPALITNGNYHFELDAQGLIVGGHYGNTPVDISSMFFPPIGLLSLPTAMNGLAALAGTPDLRTGVTAAMLQLRRYSRQLHQEQDTKSRHAY